jgi:hypothetical protein
MSENSTSQNKLKKILEEKQTIPEYQRLDIEPAEGGKPLLLNDFGKPLISKEIKNKLKVPLLKEITNEPIHCKAQPENNKKPIDNDGFVPPKSNFVSIGNTKDHVWYDLPLSSKEDEIDIDALQGLDPLTSEIDASMSEQIIATEKMLTDIKNNVVKHLSTINNLDDLKLLKINLFGKNSNFDQMLRYINILQPKEKHVIGEMIANTMSILSLELDAKEYEFITSKEETIEEDIEDEEIEDEEYNSTENISLLEGDYSIYLDGENISVEQDINIIRKMLSKLLLEDNIDISRIMLIKRIPIDFGVLIKD